MKTQVKMVCKKVRKNGFFEFMSEQGIIGLAVGLVLGTAAATLANSFINNIVMPPVGLLLGSTDGLRGVVWEISTRQGDVVSIQYGAFLNDLVNFMVILLVIYVIVRSLHIEVKKR
ncbi:MscL family protein [Candidatus Saccharibacteria bacterium]|nr:MscL family protein [Candidatus Saccharibacteria bacterium]